MQIKDIMIHDVITVTPESTINEVALLLRKHRLHGIPVIDEERKVVGIVTESDFFLKDHNFFYLPTYIEMVKEGMPAPEEMGGDGQIERFFKATVKDIMTKECVTLPEVATIEDLVTVMKRYHYITFPVTDYQNVLVGVITLVDALKYLDQK